MAFFVPICLAETDDSARTLLAVYMVGNNLESGNHFGDWGYITQNLIDMREGYGEGNPDLTVIIAYGGADKDGWREMHVYSLEKATADFLDDGEYDQWDSYTIVVPDCNMGSEEGFSRFLEMLEPYKDYSKKYLVLSGHGGAYSGVVPDENYQTGSMPLSDMKSALEKTGIHFDLIGMDACLMASLEVASALQNQADYLLASEETEPGEGWNFTVLAQELTRNPGISPEQLGKTMVDNFVQHQLNGGPGTLSLINLHRIPAVISAWDTFSVNLGEQYHENRYMQDIQQVIAESDEFGKMFYLNLGTDERMVGSYTMDLISFVQKTGNAVPGLSDDADRVIEAVQEAVVESQQYLRPRAHGLSVFSPLHKEVLINDIFTYSPDIAVSEDWYSFLIQFFRSVLSDRRPPDIKNTPDGFNVTSTDYAIVQMEFSRKTPDFDVILGSEPAYPSKSGMYTLPDWNGQAFHFINQNTGEVQIIPVFFQQQINATTEEYYAFATVTGSNTGTSWAYLDIFFDSRTGDTHIFVIFLGKETNQVIDLSYVGRMYPVSVLNGEGITPYALVQYPDGGRSWKPVTDHPFPMSQDVNYGYEQVVCGEYQYSLVAADLRGNRMAGPAKILTIPC